MRVQAWWAGNDSFRERVKTEPFIPHHPQRSPAAIANLFSLKELLKITDVGERRMKAEAARELEQFDQVKRIFATKPNLQGQMNEHELFAAAFIQ